MKKIILFAFLFLPVFAGASIDINLKYGATGSEVTELQEFLIDKGFLNTNSTGNFFSLTNSAVIKYQGSVGLPTTGFVGPMTREKINAELIAKTNTANQQEAIETGSVSVPSVNDRITQMLNQIKTLQELIAKQNQTQQSTLESLQQIQQNTTPAPVYVPPTPTYSVSLSKPVCSNAVSKSVSVKPTITGDWGFAHLWVYGPNGEETIPGNCGGGTCNSSYRIGMNPKYYSLGEELPLDDNIGNIIVRVTLFDREATRNDTTPPKEIYVTNIPLTISNICQ